MLSIIALLEDWELIFKFKLDIQYIYAMGFCNCKVDDAVLSNTYSNIEIINKKLIP